MLFCGSHVVASGDIILLLLFDFHPKTQKLCLKSKASAVFVALSLLESSVSLKVLFRLYSFVAMKCHNNDH